MKLKRFQTMRRLWLLVLVILLPLLTILIVQYRSLRALEQTMPVYRRELLLTYLRAVTFDVMRSFRISVNQALAVPGGAAIETPARERAQAIRASATEHFSNQQFKGAKRFFVAIPDEAQTQHEIFFYDPSRHVLEPDPKAPELPVIKVACAQYLISLRQGANIESNAVGNERDPAVPLILKPIQDQQQRAVAVAGMTLDQEWFSREVVPAAAKRSLPRYFPGETDEATVNLSGSNGKIVWATHQTPNDKPEAT